MGDVDGVGGALGAVGYGVVDGGRDVGDVGWAWWAELLLEEGEQRLADAVLGGYFPVR